MPCGRYRGYVIVGGIRPIVEPARQSSHHLIQCLSFPPCPLSPALSCLLALNNPPPPGVGGADGMMACDCGRGVDLLASHHAMPLTTLPLVRYCRPVIGLLVIASPMPSPPFHPFRPLLPHRLGIIISSSRLRVISSPPLAPPGLSRNGEELRADCGLFGCHRLACLPNAVSRLGRFSSLQSRPVVLVWSCCFACADDECVRSRAVAFACLSVRAF